MADVLSLAQMLWDEACSDHSLLAEYQEEKRAILQGIRQGTGVSTIISGTKNGASYTARVDFSLQDRLSALKYAIAGLQTGIRPGHISRAFFL